MTQENREIKDLVDYWRDSAEHDWKTAESLWDSRRYDACLFYCHLAMEKLIKGLVVTKTKKHAPYIHDLVELLERAGIKAEEDSIKKLAVFTGFNLRSRYSKDKLAFYKMANRKFTEPYYKEARTLILWLKKKYSKRK